MRRTTTVAVVVTMLLALFAGAALASHMKIQCPDPGSTPSCEGTKAYEDMYGTPSDDKMAGAGGNDLMYGSNGKDTVSGGDGEDMLGGDFEGSSAHEQRLLYLTANGQDPGEDKFSGGPGKDEIFARECETENESGDENCTSPTAPARDIIDCGPGDTDFASFDKKPNVKDEVKNCERLEWKPDDITQKNHVLRKNPGITQMSSAFLAATAPTKTSSTGTILMPALSTTCGASPVTIRCAPAAVSTYYRVERATTPSTAARAMTGWPANRVTTR
jgi:RTX calcium-binding nonapeptide repeat (4 copies)